MLNTHFIDEVWQNEVYLPIKGWGSPYGFIGNYTDRSAEKEYPIDNKSKEPIVPVEDG